jgi:hypothetical protein
VKQPTEEQPSRRIRRRTRGVRIGAACSAATLIGCANQQPQVVAIEPPVEVRPSSSASPARGPAPPPEETTFVLSREPIEPEKPLDDDNIHIGDKWWPFRRGFLGISEDELHDRDAAISAKQPPPAFWDRQTALEAVFVWGGLCNQCHGGRRRVEDVVAMPSPPEGWGQGKGLFFGARRPYSEVFSIIYYGGPKREDRRTMPPWRAFIAKEQIWALLYFLEYQSGGIEGRFPPSLYPRMRQPPREPEN